MTDIFIKVSFLRKALSLVATAVFSISLFVNSASAQISTYTYVLKSQLALEDGRLLAGTYDVRLSLWQTEREVAGDTLEDSHGEVVLNMQSPNFFGYIEEQIVTSDLNGYFSVTIGANVPLFQHTIDGSVFLQVDVKPSGADYTNWHRVDLRRGGSDVRKPILLSELQQTRYRFDSTESGYGGILLNKEGVPQVGEYVARISAWSSGDFDEKSDLLIDGTIRTTSSNYLGFTNYMVFKTDAFGRFSLPFGSVTPINKEVRDVYIQLDMKEKQEMTNYFDLIDPDGDMESKVDRFILKSGKITTVDTNNVAKYGEQEKILVSNVPSGTSLNYFELGVGNTLPKAYFEIRARQSDGKQAVLRFNSLKKIWEVSNDGIDFYPLGGYLDGTRSDTFTIGLQNDAEFLTLQFGDRLSAARFSYDRIRDVFQVNKSIDFEQNQLINSVLENRSSAPLNPVAGQQYFDTSKNQAFYYNGAQWFGMGTNSTNNSGGFLGGGGTGATGPQGPAGPQGIQGAIGPQGPAGTGGGGGGVSDWTDLPPRNKTQVYAPNYADMILLPLAGSGKGTMSEERDAASNKNHYRWVTNQAGKQTMQVVVEWNVPQDFTGFQAIPFMLDYKTSTNTNPLVGVDMTITKNGVPLGLLSGANLTSTTASTWEVAAVSFTGAPVFAAGDKVTFTFALSAVAGAYTDVGAFSINYLGR